MDDAHCKANIGFLERLDVINNLTQSLASKDPNLPHSQIVQQAQLEEIQCLNQARSKDDYLRLWSTKLEDLQSHTHPPTSSAKDNPLVDQTRSKLSAVDIGPYQKAVPFTSGIFSTLYRYSSSSVSTSHGSTGDYLALKVTDMFAIQPPHDPVREVRLLKNAAGHINILTCLDDFRLPSSFVMVAPYYTFTLASLLEDGRISTLECKKVILDVFTGLAHLHSLEILHRDVKPSNILLNSVTSPAVLADFGIAWSASDPSSEPTNKKISDVGTTWYRAPELLFGYQGYGEGVDIWAMGCILAECLDPVHDVFFDSGDLGSELRLISSIFQKLGTPTPATWPEAAKFPDFGKLSFIEYSIKSWEELLPHGDPLSRELMSRLLVYEKTERISAAQAVIHPYFDSIRDSLQQT